MRNLDRLVALAVAVVAAGAVEAADCNRLDCLATVDLAPSCHRQAFAFGLR